MKSKLRALKAMKKYFEENKLTCERMLFFINKDLAKLQRKKCKSYNNDK